jgi:hypothetical protein
MPATAEDWALIRRAYEDTRETIKSIAARFNVATGTISNHAKNEDWRPRPRRLVVIRRGYDGGVRTAVQASASPASRPPDAPDVRIERLYRVIDLQLESLEREMSSGEPATAQDQERRARALHTIIDSFEKAKEAAAELLKREQHAAGESCADTERSRRELAARLEKLGTRWDTDAKS